MSVLDRYTVIETGDEQFPYELHGPRGARYKLTRNVPNPHLLFAMNARSFGVMERLGWFTDKDGKLESIR